MSKLLIECEYALIEFKLLIWVKQTQHRNRKSNEKTKHMWKTLTFLKGEEEKKN